MNHFKNRLVHESCSIFRSHVLRELRLLVVVDIDNSLRPLASVDLALEQNVNLTVRSVLHLR